MIRTFACCARFFLISRPLHPAFISRLSLLVRTPLCHLEAGPTCINGIPGIECAKGACCIAACGQCGGIGCSMVAADLGLGSAECCEGTILLANEPCGEAPCVVGGAWRGLAWCAAISECLKPLNVNGCYLDLNKCITAIGFVHILGPNTLRPSSGTAPPKARARSRSRAKLRDTLFSLARPNSVGPEPPPPTYL